MQLYPQPLTVRPRLPNGPAAPDSSIFEELKPLSVLGSRVAATGCRVRTPGRGPKAFVELWSSPRVLAALLAQCL